MVQLGSFNEAGQSGSSGGSIIYLESVKLFEFWQIKLNTNVNLNYGSGPQYIIHYCGNKQLIPT